MALQSIYLGDAVEVTIPMRVNNARFVPAAGYQLIFTAKLSADNTDSAAVIQKKSGGFGLTESKSNAVVALLPIDTSPLAGGITLYCDIQAQSLTDAADIKTVALFQLLTVRDVTRLTDTSITVYTSEPPGAAITVDTTTNLNGFLAGDGANVQLATTAQKLALPVSTAQAAADAVVLAAAIQRSNHTGTQTLATISDAGTAAASATGDFTPIAHASDTANPHTVTKAQVGLGNVDNTSDANAPVSTAQQTALDLKVDLASDSTITVKRGTTDILSAAALRTAYTAAKALTPGGNALSATNRAVVMIPAGRYDFGLGDVGDSNHGLELDAQFVDLVGATGVREEVILTSAIAVASRGTVEQTADDVRISFLTMEITSASSTGGGATEAAAYFPTTALANAVLTDVICQSETTGVLSMRASVEYAGTYTRVTSGGSSFGYSGTASGTFTDCVGGTNSFGGTASGTFTDCVAGNTSFGYGGTASGTFIRCVGGYENFGAQGTASGTFTECVAGGNYSFGGYGGTASGTFTDCVGAAWGFGGFYGTASGTFTDCTGGTNSFGGDGGTVDAGAVFIRCHGADTHMNTGKTRACYTSAWATIDNE